MRRGKEIAQGAHASLGAILSLGNYYNSQNPNGGLVRTFVANLDDRSYPWLTGRFAKVTVIVNSEEELLELEKVAKEKGLITCLIQDSGFTEFKGVPTYTTLAIGPDKNENIDPITKHLKLY